MEHICHDGTNWFISCSENGLIKLKPQNRKIASDPLYQVSRIPVDEIFTVIMFETILGTTELWVRGGNR